MVDVSVMTSTLTSNDIMCRGPGGSPAHAQKGHSRILTIQGGKKPSYIPRVYPLGLVQKLRTISNAIRCFFVTLAMQRKDFAVENFTTGGTLPNNRTSNNKQDNSSDAPPRRPCKKRLLREKASIPRQRFWHKSDPPSSL